ncbi:Uncharacterised protein [Vibrio cholerae]|nr:Uncharacterised protein [Vibrio cholerae]
MSSRSACSMAGSSSARLYPSLRSAITLITRRPSTR